MSSSTLMPKKKQLLENRRTHLMAQYEAIFNQRENTLNEGDKVTLTNQLLQKDTEIKEVDAQLLSLDEPIAHQVASPQPANSILFFLPNRGEQKRQLKETIRVYQTQYSDKKQRPLLCLLHGKDNEYGHFINCLLEDFLRHDNALAQYFRKGLYEIELLLEEFHTVAQLHQEILEFLENKIHAKPEKEAIAHKLAKEQRPIIVHIRLLTQDLADWQEDQKTIIDGFIEFWADWPQKIYAQHPLFLVFLSFSYEEGKNHFSWFKNWFCWKKPNKATNAVLRNQFETLGDNFPTIMAFFAEKKVHAKVLPKLESVKRKSACNWIKIYETQIKQFWNDTYALEDEVKALYDNKDAIPMEELARELKNLLTNPNPETLTGNMND